MNLMHEWLEADGLGGFASGTVGGRRTRRYHALLLVHAPSAGRFVLVNGLDAHVTTSAGTYALSSQKYLPDVVHPDGERRLDAFRDDPWPCWTYRLDDGTRIEQELFVPHGSAAVALRWRLLEGSSARLSVRPFFSGRDYHSLHHENGAFGFDPERVGDTWVWRPYNGVPATFALANGVYRHEPLWFRRFHYDEEAGRGLDASEDLASPGTWDWDLARGDAVLLLTTDGVHGGLPLTAGAVATFAPLREAELRRRKAFASPLHRAADAYLVRRGSGKTIIAGYPWFTDWGRDTFIALRGLCLATGRLDDARAILVAWAAAVSEGMLPNRFGDGAGAAEFNAVDASLWYVIAVGDYLRAAEAAGQPASAATRATLRDAVLAILTGYARGTRHGIRLDGDGLLAAGEPGVQLTWMDARIGDWVVTPRIGKPVEVQALWLNALAAARVFTDVWEDKLGQGRASFGRRFWNEAAGSLYDVVDVDHRPGVVDPAFRPNQIFAVGGLPLALLDGARARRVVDAVEARLATPFGLRSLAPDQPGYVGRYGGGVRERDGAYHQGTVWPWLLGPFVEAWVRVRGGTDEAKREARRRFLEPLRHHLGVASLGHIAEVADGDVPHRPGGCPFQAWSVGEVLRLEFDVLAGAVAPPVDAAPVGRTLPLSPAEPSLRDAEA